MNRLWEFHQIYKFSAVGGKDELIRFRDQNLKCQDHTAARPNVLFRRGRPRLSSNLFRLQLSCKNTAVDNFVAGL